MNAPPASLPLRVHDFGPDLCLSCGGHAGSAFDDQGRETMVCTTCGVLDGVVFTNDIGEPVQGLMSLRELQQLSFWPEADHGEEDIPF